MVSNHIQIMYFAQRGSEYVLIRRLCLSHTFLSLLFFPFHQHIAALSVVGCLFSSVNVEKVKFE